MQSISPSRWSIFIMLIIVMCIQHNVQAQSLSGVYTINNTQATGGNNYHSFTEFCTALNTNGISGPVIANVTAGTPYNERMVLGNITGSSSTNTIRINGNGALLQYQNTTMAKELLVMNGSRYITIDSMNFTALSDTFGWGALIYNNAQNDSILRCYFNLPNSNANEISHGIYFGTPDSTTGPVSCTNCYLAYNTIKGASANMGIHYGININSGNNITIFKNTIRDFYLAGINAANTTTTDLMIDGNDIHALGRNTAAAFYGIYLSDAKNVTIRNNKIHDPYNGTGTYDRSFAGVYSTKLDTTTYTYIYNNLIYNISGGNGGLGSVTGIRVQSGPKHIILHNTVDMRRPLSYTGSFLDMPTGIYIQGSGTQQNVVKNNLVNMLSSSQSTPSKTGVFYRLQSMISAAQNNNYHIIGGSQNYFGTCPTASMPTIPQSFATRALFQSAIPNIETGSLDYDPQFNNPNTIDFRPTNPALLGMGTPLGGLVPTDMNGNPRPANPTMGALEWTAAAQPNNGAINSITTRTLLKCAGNHKIRVALQNVGTNTIDSIRFNWQINGVSQAPILLPTNMAAANAAGIHTDTLILPSVPVNGPTTVKVWIQQVNGQTDIDHTNDTLQTSFVSTAFTINLFNDTLCANQAALMKLAPFTGYNAYDTLQWQSSANNVNWTDMSGAQIPYWAGSVTTPTWYRARIATENVNCYTDTVHITLLSPSIASVWNDTICGPGSLSLNATPGAGSVINWYTSPTGGSPVFTGNNFTTPLLSANTTYYVGATLPGSPQLDSAGPYNFTYKLNNMNVPEAGLVFDAAVPFTLSSVDLFGYHSMSSASTGTVTVGLKNASGSLLQSATFTVTGDSVGVRNELPLNFYIPAGQNYRLVLISSAPNAFKIIGEPNYYGYPVPLPNAGYIKSGWYIGGYNYFYNWKIRSGCESNRVPVEAIIYPVPQVDLGPDTLLCAQATMNLDAGNPGSGYLWNTAATTQTINTTNHGIYAVTVTNSYNCSATDSITVGTAPIPAIGNITHQAGVQAGEFLFGVSSPQYVDQYNWDFGDGQSASGPAPTHIYTSSGSYAVTVHLSNSCDTVDRAIIINVTLPNSIAELGETDQDIKVYPNPAQQYLSVAAKETKLRAINIFNILGQTVYQDAHVTVQDLKIPLQGLSSGTYILHIETDKGISYRKFSVIK